MPYDWHALAVKLDSEVWLSPHSLILIYDQVS